MIEVMKLGTLRTNREPSPLDDLKKLEASLRTEGLQVPLLVNRNRYVIDGVRRLAAIRRLGYTEAICQVTDDIDEALENLTEGRKSPLQVLQTPSRIYGQYSLISVMGKSNQMARRASRGTTGSKKDGTLRYAESINSYRDRYLEIMGLKTYLLQETISMYNLLEELSEDNPSRKQFAEALERLDRGEVSMTRAHKIYARLKRTEGSSLNSGAQQNQILTQALGAMEGMWRGLQDTVPLSSNVDRETVANYITESRAFISRMRILTNEIERQLNE